MSYLSFYIEMKHSQELFFKKKYVNTDYLCEFTAWFMKDKQLCKQYVFWFGKGERNLTGLRIEDFERKK